MNSEPKFCNFCGGKMKWLNTKVPWHGLMICAKNGHLAIISYGDQMGGAPYCSVEWLEKPMQKKKLK